jgi:hypothetical protein
MPPTPVPDPPIGKITLDQAKISLATLNERLASTENLRIAATEQVAELTAQVQELRTSSSTAAADLAAVKAERDSLVLRFQDTASTLSATQSTVLSQQEELGRLRPVEGELQQVKAERDVSRAELDTVRANIPQLVNEQVNKQVSELTQAHADEVTALTAQRDQLASRVTELENAAGAAGQEGITPATLAGHFADVLADLGNRAPIGDAGFSAAVTGMNIEAMGMLRTTQSGSVELITEPSGVVPKEQLSKVSFELKLLPRLQDPMEPK